MRKKKKKERGIDTLHLEITLTVPLSVFSSITLTGSAYSKWHGHIGTRNTTPLLSHTKRQTVVYLRGCVIKSNRKQSEDEALDRKIV